jgi:hypothetical protein
MAEIPRNSTGLSGEYFAAAELYRRGWSGRMTIKSIFELFQPSPGLPER